MTPPQAMPLPRADLPRADLPRADLRELLASWPDTVPGTTGHWRHNPQVVFLNHGSFGNVPSPVVDAQRRHQDLIDRDPVHCLARQADTLLEPTYRAIAKLIHARPDDIALMTNATEAINGILRSLMLSPGDELLTTDHVYNAVRQTMRSVAKSRGAVVREVGIDLPLTSSRQVLEAIAGGLNERTRVLVIDHVTSPTALVFPVSDICSLCRQRGVDVLVDAAHAVGMFDVDVPSLQATWYVANLHKWLCAPRGSAMAWVAPHRQADFHPNIISHFWGSGFLAERSWQGTRDISGWMAVADAAAYWERIGWPAVWAHNHACAVITQQLLCHAWGVEPISPADGSMLGTMTSVPLPMPFDHRLPAERLTDLQRRLYHDCAVEAPFMHIQGRWLIRPCLQVYNTAADVERLARAIADWPINA